jgi:hypothetical protein
MESSALGWVGGVCNDMRRAWNLTMQGDRHKQWTNMN